MGPHGLVLLALAGTASAPTAPSDPLPSAPAPIRAVSLNIANGAGYITAADRATQNAFLAALAPDLVGMQEVEVGVARSGGGNTAVQATATMPGSIRFARCSWVDAQGRGNSTGPGQAGVALWVRPGLTVVDSWMVPIDWELTTNGGDGWARCALAAHITGEGHDFSVAITHLMVGTNHAVRRAEVQEAATYGVDLFLGDMNAMGDEIAGYMPPLLHLCSKPDFPGCIDQVWAQGGCSGWLEPTHSTASDHPYAAIAVVNVP